MWRTERLFHLLGLFWFQRWQILSFYFNSCREVSLGVDMKSLVSLER